jgi:hypothetical protein
MIPNYPEFKKLELSDKEEFDAFITQYPPYSDFNFVSMWTYNTDNSIQLSYLNNNLVVRFTDYLSRQPFYSFLGITRVGDTFDSLIQLAKSERISAELKLIPEIVILSENNLQDKYEIIEDWDNHDYIISVPAIAELHPEIYGRKRRLVEQFKRKYQNHSIDLIDIADNKLSQKILDVFMEWESVNRKSREDTENELTAIKRLFEMNHKSNLFVLGIYDLDKLIAFNIYEIVHHRYGISAFQKANKNYTGIYATLSHEAAKHLLSLNCEFVNYEQDLGIEGLRLSKSLWKPKHFLKKYIVRQKSK